MVLCASAVHAQAIRDPVAEIHARQERALQVSKTVETAPGSSSAYALPAPEVSLQTTRDGTEATAVIGVSNPFWGFRTTFKTPIGKEADAEATPFSLAGLGKQATVDFTHIRKRVFRRREDIDEQMLGFCAQHGIADGKCSDQAFANETLRNEFLNIGIHAQPTFATAHLQIGGKQFEFVETGSSTKLEEKRTSFAAGGSYGWLFLNRQSVFAISIDGARDYTASEDATELCQPITTDAPGTERCDARTIGRPQPSRKVTTTLDFRRVFLRTVTIPAQPGKDGEPPTPSPVPQQSKPVVGLGLQLRLQAMKDKKPLWVIDVPVYFLQKAPADNNSVALNGGATTGWNSKDGFIARVFIGTAFALLGGDFE